MLGTSSAYVLGDTLNDGLQWHVFVAGPQAASSTAVDTAPTAPPIHTLEVCMTGLSTAKAAQFFRSHPGFVSSQHTTITSGIADLVPAHDINDYVFEPCGYSMNGMANAEFSTIHITPEDGFSYASFEVCGYSPERMIAAEVVAMVAGVLEPRTLAVALSMDTVAPGPNSPGWGSTFAAPVGYECHSASYQEIKCGGFVAYLTLEKSSAPSHAKRVSGRVPDAAPVALPALKTAPVSAPGSNNKNQGGFASDNACLTSAPHGSPRAVLKHFPSFKTIDAVASVPADIELMAASSDNSSDCGLSATERPLASACLPYVDDVAALHGAAPLPRGDQASVDAHISALIAAHGLEDNFYVMDLGAVHRLYRAWGESMPRVHPHYAVKCNNDPALLATLAALGAGFDCASSAEVEQVVAMGVSPDRIIFANPCKRPADIRSAAMRGITHSTFDTEAELLKLRRWAPGSRVLLRIRADDPGARCPLGNKFGAEEWEWEPLLAAAKRHGVPVDGVSFHVGSGATNPSAFSYAIELARRAFDLGAAYGFEMTVLDVGGGFNGGRVDVHGRVDLGGVPSAINSSLAKHFPEDSGIRVIAEPGRYFAETVATLATLVYGRRQRPQSASRGGSALMDYDYWVTDGLYGSMNCLLYDHATVKPRPLLDGDRASGPCRPSTVFGPTCDGLDTVVRDYPLPELEVGDWLLFPRMGAYTICGASKFNGINAVDVPTFYVCSSKA